MRHENDFNRISDALSFVPAHDRDTWVRMGMAIKSELGEAGFDLWDQWSRQDDSYNARDARSVWKSIDSNGKITIATLFHEAKANGWQDNQIYIKTSAAEIAERKRIAAEKFKQDEEDEEKVSNKKAQAALLAKKIWKKATDIKNNPYLTRKEVSPISTMKEIEASEVASILGYAPKSDGEMLMGRLLVIPIVIDAKFSSVEFIDGEGRKAALAGKGTKSRGYWVSQSLPDSNDETIHLLIGEGAITVLSAKEVTGYPAIAALSSSNLLSVSKIMRKRYPKAILIILADLVKATGLPDPHAIGAAQAIGGLLAIPDFGPNRAFHDKDFNDMKRLIGHDATHKSIINAKLVALDQRSETDVTSVDSRFAVITAAKFALIESASWLIKGIIPKAEIVMVYGPSGSGKSFLVLDFAFAIARGIEWSGHKVYQDRVVYIAAEAAGGLRKRLVAYAQYNHIKLDDLPLDIIPVAPNFLGSSDVTEISQSINQAGLIILDTLACVVPGGDENSSTDMGKLLAHCKLLHESTGAVVMLVHHMGKDMTKGARGWSGLRAAVDAEMEVKSTGHGFQIRMTKLKDGGDNQTYSFHLVPVTIGTDEDGDSITSCVIKSTTDFSIPIKPERTGKWEKNVIKAVKQLTDQAAHVLVDTVIDCAVNMEPVPINRDQRKSSARRAFKKLIEEKYYVLNDGIVLIPEKEFWGTTWQ